MDTPEISIFEKIMLNAIEDPDELAEFAASHEKAEVCKAALEKLMKMDLVEERKAVLVCSVVKKTSHEPVAEYALNYCLTSNLPDKIKSRIIKKTLEGIKSGSLRDEMEKWLKEHEH